jgi:hypothetical protein
LGDGDFGVVSEGRLRRPGKPEMLVAVKRLNETYMSSLLIGSNSNREEFLKEAKIMMELEHDHIVRLIGFCFEPMRYMMVCNALSKVFSFCSTFSSVLIERI